jgi:hypothetical protein
LLLLQSFLLASYSFENVFILVSGQDQPNISIDGRQTDISEWSGANRQTVESQDGAPFMLLAVHDSDYLYLRLELGDQSEHSTDQAYICFDTDHDGGSFDEGDYCFYIGMTEKQLKAIQGIGEDSAERWREANPEGAAASSGISESTYISTPHAFYEFRIPLELVGDSDEFGFYALVIDGNTDKRYDIPSTGRSSMIVPDPYRWGLMVFLDSERVFDVKPALTNGNITFYLVDEENLRLLLLLKTDEEIDGELEISLPRKLIDSKARGEDIDFSVLVDGEETSYEETESSDTERRLRIPIIHGSGSVEIQGTQLSELEVTIVPEFPVSAILLMTVPLLALICLWTRYNYLR